MEEEGRGLTGRSYGLGAVEVSVGMKRQKRVGWIVMDCMGKMARFERTLGQGGLWREGRRAAFSGLSMRSMPSLRLAGVVKPESAAICFTAFHCCCAAKVVERGYR